MGGESAWFIFYSMNTLVVIIILAVVIAIQRW